MSAPLVVFGEDWNSHPSSTQHLVAHLRADRPIIWVNSIGMRRPRLGRHDVGRIIAKLRDAVRSPSPATSGARAGPSATPGAIFHVISPLAFPAPRSRWARAVNRFLLGRAIRKALRAHRLRHPVLWLSLPTAVDVVGTLGERSVIYYVGDDWSSMPGIDHLPVQKQEMELAEKADWVVAASPAIAKKFAAAKTAVLLHGVDVQKFAGPDVPRARDLPADGTPVAGFYGTLSDWMDTELLAYIALRLPRWRLVLVGPAQTDVSALREVPNVVMIGPRRHDDLPGYVRHWNVSLLPFRETGMTRAFNPLKLREYLAAGTPIVSTDFPALDGYRDLVEVARTPDAFVAAMLRAHAEGRRRAQERVRRVAGETWEARARFLGERLKQMDRIATRPAPAADRR